MIETTTGTIMQKYHERIDDEIELIKDRGGFGKVTAIFTVNDHRVSYVEFVVGDGEKIPSIKA